jgi:hypothetical protein
MAKKGRSGGGSGGGGSNKSSSSASTTSASTGTRAHRSILEQFDDNVEKNQKFTARLGASIRSWATEDPRVSEIFGNLQALLKEIEPRVSELKGELFKLGQSGFVPTSASRAPKFAVGETVSVDSEWVEKYTKSGIYKPEELMTLEIVTVGDKEVLCKTAKGREILIRAIGHLEATTLEKEAETEAA